MPGGGSCAPCSPGTSKASTGDAACSQCLDNTESTEGASACVAKPGFTIQNRVRFTMRVSKTLAQFDEAAQQLYKQDIATRASVDVSQVTIISINEVQSNVLRRLLSTSLDVGRGLASSLCCLCLFVSQTSYNLLLQVHAVLMTELHVLRYWMTTLAASNGETT